MENKNVKRINLIGKVSKILLIIAQVFLILGIVSSIILAVGIMQIPDDCFKINGNFTAQVLIDEDRIPPMLDMEEDIETLEKLADINQKFKGIEFNMTVDESVDGAIAVNADGYLENQDVSDYKYIAIPTAISAVFVLVTVLLIAIFAFRLADAFAKCSSPFEANVLKRMKHFGISMIPWAVMECLASDSVAVSAILFTVVVILFVQIFSYGATIQQENDDMV